MRNIFWTKLSHCNMSFEKILKTLLNHDYGCDQQKRSIIFKALQHLGRKNLTYEEALPLFETCLYTALENNASKVAIMSLFAFATWGNKFPNHLREYMGMEQITNVVAENDPAKLMIILAWLKEGLQILVKDVDYIANISPILSGILENKLLENGRHSAIMSQISELYLLCPSLLPLQHLRLKFTISILHCVASFPTPTKPETLKHMKNVGNVINMLWETLQLEDILSTLIAMYSIISNPDTSVEVCPAMAHILSLVFTQVVEGLGPRIVSDPHSSNESFVATLIRLCSWLITWPTAHVTLVHWIKTLVRLLYQSGRTIVPAKITYDQVPKLLDGLRIPVCRHGVLSVATILLMSFQYSPVAFHKMIGNMIVMVECLGSENTESAQETLQGLIKLCYAQMAIYPGHPETYQSLMDVLMKYPHPSDQEVQLLIQEHNWLAPFSDGPRLLDSSKNLNKLLGVASSFGSAPMTYHKRAPGQKVGLQNLGNTCYMNSVIQALFMTDDFRHSVLHTNPRSNQQLLVKLQHLFTTLCFSHRSHISPRTFHDTSRPPWFSPGMQHDCSEYLRHLMITLHEEERSGQKLPEYQERMIIESETTSLASDLQPLPDDNYQDQAPVSDSSMTDEQQQQQQQQIKMGFKCSSDSKFDEDLFPESRFSKGSHGSKEDMGPMSPGHPRVFTFEKEDQDVEKLKEEDVAKSVLSPSVVNKRSFCRKDNLDKPLESWGLDAGPTSTKRKHKVSPTSSQSPISKSPKGESSLITSETDNSSDSGISGDLTEEIDFQLAHRGGGPSADKGLFIHEIADTLDNDYFVSQVHKTFGGKISTCIKCLNCKTESIHKDVFTDINLAFQDSDQYSASSAIRRQPERVCKQKQGDAAPDLKIEDMIANFLRSERLTGENQYECNRCGGKQDADRSIRVLETPEHLILTQLRFYYDTSKGQRQKVFTNVEFGEELLFPSSRGRQDSTSGETSPQDGADVANPAISPDEESVCHRTEAMDLSTVDSLATYDRYALYGVVVHSGFSSEGGHYYCYARNSSLASIPQVTRDRFEGAGEWFNFNDERVTKTTFCSIARLTKTFSRDTAYLLFYRKVHSSESLKAHSMGPPLVEDLSNLPRELQEVLEADNLQYRSEQEADFLRRRSSRTSSGGSLYKRQDEDDNPPSSGGSCGGGNGLKISSREIF